jgi:D-glycero-alpha-D-manno-heptose 1-phosphate guanylyltransferase
MMQLVVLAGGLGTRMKAIAGDTPKCMIDVAGRNFLSRQLDNWISKGIPSTKIRIVNEKTPLGTLGALIAERKHLGKCFLLTFADSYLTCDFAAVEKAFIDSGKPILMSILKNKNRWVPSNVIYRGGEIAIYNKAIRGHMVDYVDYGLYGFSRDVLKGLKAPADLSEFISKRISQHGDVAAYVVPEKDRFYEIGSPSGYKEACQYFKGRDKC